MDTWEEFLLSDEFAAYRAHQASLIANTIHHVLNTFQPKDAEWLKGAMDMAFKIVRLPRELLPKDSKLRAVMSKQIEREMADVTAHLIFRGFSAEDGDDED